jgi:uncharacterized membrane protein YdjX (TVP38/TMEM64 family)
MPKRFLPLIVLVLLVVAAFAAGAGRYLSLDALAAHRADLLDQVAAHLALSLAVFIALYAAVVALSIPSALMLNIAGGLLFGPWLGAAASTVGVTLGSLAIFLVVRTSLGQALRERAERTGGRFKAIMDGMATGAFGYVLTLRLLPVAPLWLTNLAAALAHAPIRPYALATVLGVIPSTVIFSHLGVGLGRLLEAGQRPGLATFLRADVLGPLLALGLLSLAATLIQRRRVRSDSPARR